MIKRVTHSNIVFIASCLLAILVILSCILCAVTAAQFNRRFNALSEFYGVRLNYEAESSSINPFAKGNLHYELPNGINGFYRLEALVFPFGIRGTLTPGDEASKHSADFYKIEPVYFGGGIFSRNLEIKTKAHQEVKVQEGLKEIIYSDVKLNLTDGIDTFVASHIRVNEANSFVDLRDLKLKGDLKKLSDDFEKNLLNCYLDLSIGKLKHQGGFNFEFQNVFLSRQLLDEKDDVFKLSFYIVNDQGREGRVEIHGIGDALNDFNLATLKPNDLIKEQVKISLKGKIFRENKLFQELIKKGYFKVKDTTYISNIELKIPFQGSIDEAEIIVNNDKRLTQSEIFSFILLFSTFLNY